MKNRMKMTEAWQSAKFATKSKEYLIHPSLSLCFKHNLTNSHRQRMCLLFEPYSQPSYWADICDCGYITSNNQGIGEKGKKISGEYQIYIQNKVPYKGRKIES